MNILMIFPGKVWGGAEQYVLDLGIALHKLGHNVSYATLPSRAVASRLDGHIPYSTVDINSFFIRSAIKRLSGLLKGVDVVHVHELKHVRPISQAAKIAGLHPKIVVTRHIARASRTLLWHRNAIKHVHRIIFVSHLAEKLWRGVNSWMPTDKCVVIHNSIPSLSDAASMDIRKQYGVPDGVPLIVFAGRVRKSKGCDTLIEALGKLTDLQWHILFVGSCKPRDYDKHLNDMAEAYRIADRVHFHGFSANARGIIKSADIGVASSIVREACALSPMEFMQAGKATVASNNGSQPEYITDGITGLLVPPADAESLAESLRKLIIAPSFRKRIGIEAKKYFDEILNYDTFLQRVLEAYK